MVTLYYEFFGGVPQMEYQGRPDHNISHSKKRLEKWLKLCMFQLNSGTRPNLPISKVLIEKVNIFYSDYKKQPSNIEAMKPIRRFMLDAGLVKSESIRVLPTTKVTGKFRQDFPGWELFLIFDETLEGNKDIDLSKLPIL